jgi:26S proteasome regulatory subunit N6
MAGYVCCGAASVLVAAFCDSATLIWLAALLSSVEISHVAKLINLPEQQVVHKLSQMILDHKFFGILDQGRGHLIIYESSQEDSNFAKGVEIIGNMEGVVEVLFGRTKALAKGSA